MQWKGKFKHANVYLGRGRGQTEEREGMNEVSVYLGRQRKESVIERMHPVQQVT